MNGLFRILLLATLCSCAAAVAGAGSPSVSVSEGYVATDDGVRLFYRRVETGPDVVVYLHGGPGSNFRGNGTEMDALATPSRSLIMYDQRGSGKSSLVADPDRLTLEHHVRDLDTIRNHFGVQRITIIGLSWGSALAVWYTHAHPGNVKRLLLISPMPLTKELSLQRRAKMDRVAGEIAAARRAQIVTEIRSASSNEKLQELCREFSDLTFRAYLSRPAPRALRKAAERCDIPPAAIRNRFVVEQATNASIGAWDLRPVLDDINLPALVLEGAETKVPLDSTEEWARHLRNGRMLLIPHAGHELFLDEPISFLRVALQFLGGRFPPRAKRLRVVTPHP